MPNCGTSLAAFKTGGFFICKLLYIYTMSYTALQDTNIFIDLPLAAKSTGWSVDGTIASHESCNDGDLTILNYTLTIGETYRYSYEVLSISSGYVQASLGAAQTSPGFIVETGVAASTVFSFYANGVCSIKLFSIEVVAAITSPYAQNTIAFNETINKWTSFYSYIPDNAFSIYTRLYSFYQGDAYVHDSGTGQRCEFYGVQYPATIYISSNQQPSLSKTFISLNYQASQLLVSPSLGINTSTGQQSELIAIDFLQEELTEGVKTYEVENLFKASFVRAYPDFIEGNQLIGNYITIGLETTSASSILTLFTSEIAYVHNYQNIR